jgi:hypothetical protein
VAKVIVLSPSQLAPTANESITISFDTTALAAIKIEVLDPLSSPSVNANILKMQFGYFFFIYINYSVALIIES